VHTTRKTNEELSQCGKKKNQNKRHARLFKNPRGALSLPEFRLESLKPEQQQKVVLETDEWK